MMEKGYRFKVNSALEKDESGIARGLKCSYLRNRG